MSLSIIAGFNYSDSGFQVIIPTTSVAPTVTGAAGDSSVSATSSGTALPLAGITNPTKLAIKNTGDTNALLISFDAGSSWPVSIAPGEANMISLASSGLTIQYKTASSTTTFSYGLAA